VRNKVSSIISKPLQQCEGFLFLMRVPTGRAIVSLFRPDKNWDYDAAAIPHAVKLIF
jgi:hypothetical protein